MQKTPETETVTLHALASQQSYIFLVALLDQDKLSLGIANVAAACVFATALR
jgi:hypothetical protein